MRGIVAVAGQLVLAHELLCGLFQRVEPRAIWHVVAIAGHHVSYEFVAQTGWDRVPRVHAASPSTLAMALRTIRLTLYFRAETHTSDSALYRIDSLSGCIFISKTKLAVEFG